MPSRRCQCCAPCVCRDGSSRCSRASLVKRRDCARRVQLRSRRGRDRRLLGRDAAAKFVVVVVGEIAYGMTVGWAALSLRHLSRDPRAEVLLALATPFIAFWPPHMLGGSGVVACVTAGLWVSWNGRRLIRPETRLQGYFFWDLIVWAVEALVFLLTGLQARAVIENLSAEDWPRAPLWQVRWSA